jgi:two-component system chemotaxis response regulator CheB
VSKLHVLVIDDSAVMRMVCSEVLSREPDMMVTAAADPIVAKDKMARARPDVILLDLSMPRMDGLTFLRKLMKDDPLPVVVCSALAERGSHLAMQALESGAVDVVAKPQIGVREFLEESAVTLSDALRAAAEAGGRRRRKAPATLPTLISSSDPGPRPQLIAVGASTGGPEALTLLLRSLPAGAPPMVVAQHMPAPFTGAFAHRMDSLCACAVAEARDGDEVLPGRVLIAPGGRHLLVHRSGGRLYAQVPTGRSCRAIAPAWTCSSSLPPPRPAPARWACCSPAWARMARRASRTCAPRARSPSPRTNRPASSTACPRPPSTWAPPS